MIGARRISARERAVRERSSAAADGAQRPGTLARVLTAALVLVVLVASAARFWGLDRKIYSFDETITSLHAAGHTLPEYGAFVTDRVVTAGAFLTFLSVAPDSSPAATVHALAAEDPQHPPLYYLGERAVAQTFGSSVAAWRLLSAVAGVLLVAATVWLMLELTGSLLAGLVGAALVAVSPFFLLYSQQAREYTLWALFVALSGAALLRAQRTNAAATWIGYALALAAGLYTDLLFVFVIAAHAAFVGFVELRARSLRCAVPFAAAVAAALALFAPWLVAVVRGAAAVTNNENLGAPLSAPLFALKWIFNLGAVFFDLDYHTPALAVVLLPLFAFLAFAAIVLVRARTPRVAAFILTLVGVCAAGLLVPDVLLHASRSSAARYLVPVWYGVQLLAAWALARGIAASHRGVRAFATAGVAALVALGVVSAAADLPATTSWAEGRAIAGMAPIAEIVNATPHPLVVYEADPQRWDFTLAAIAYRLRPDVELERFGFPRRVAADPRPGVTTYLLSPTARVRAAAAPPSALTQLYDDRDDAAAAIRRLRAQATAIRERAGINEETGLTLWRVAPQP